jgi:drug/metabolite transporter (DMT)-like permease
MTRTQQGLLLIVLATSGYAMLPIFAKLGYAEGFAPLDMLTWRFVIAAPVIWLLARAEIRTPEHHASLKSFPFGKLLLMGLMFSVMAMQAFFALERIPASTYIVLTYLYPGFVALFSLLEGERLPLAGWLALGLATFGVVLTVPDFAVGLGGDPFGLFLAFINGLTYAVYVVISNRVLRGQRALALASALTITGALSVFLAFSLVRGLVIPQTLNGWGILVGVALISTAMPIFAFYAGVQRVGAPQAAIMGTFEPVLVLVMSFLLLGETMQPIQVVGGALILGGVVLLQAGRLRDAHSKARRETPDTAAVTVG